MKIIRKIEEIQQLTTTLRKENKSIGFVPTMGYLHEGHMSLMKHARENDDVVVASIFVNPLQFGPNEDFESYPRDEARDVRIAEETGVDILFLPDVKEMYPHEPIIQMKIVDRTDVLCGRSRPGHFDGVITVLTKLFHIVQPDRAYFGIKDAQQVAVVDALIQELNFPLELVSVPTVREPDGLAKSSRNVRLSEDERKEAVWIYRALTYGKELIEAGEKQPEKIIPEVIRLLEKNISGKIDYVEMLSYPELKQITEINGKIILAAAVHFENARLIDNLIIDK